MQNSLKSKNCEKIEHLRVDASEFIPVSVTATRARSHAPEKRWITEQPPKARI